MNLGQMTLIVFGILMIVGGAMGMKAGSKVSLIAGGTSGVLILVAYVVSRFNMNAGLWMGAVLALLLAGNFLMRWMKTGKVMPAAALMAVSLVALAILAQQIMGQRGGGS